MKNNKLFFKIYVSMLSICILTLIILALLGKINRVGYLSDLQLNIDKTLVLNGFDICNTKKLFIIDNKLDNDSLINYLSTNKTITNYSYGFRIKYYSKVFRNSDIYGVFIDTNKTLQENNFIKEIKMNDKGSPFGNLISSKELSSLENIDNVNYHLKVKYKVLLLIFTLFIIIFYSKFASFFILTKIILFCSLIKNNIKLLKVISLILTAVLLLLYFNLNEKYKKGYLYNFTLLDKSELGYIYKAKIKNNILFNLFLDYSDNLSLKLDNIDNILLGYHILINRIPENTFSVEKNSNNNLVFNNATNFNFYNNLIPLINNELYKVSIKARNLDTNYGYIKLYGFTYELDDINNVENDSNNFKVYYSYIEPFNISKKDINSYAQFIFPEGSIEVENIKIEQLDTKYKKYNGVIITSNTPIKGNKNIEIEYALKFNKFINAIFYISLIFSILIIIKFLFDKLKIKYIFMYLELFLYKLFNNKYINNIINFISRLDNITFNKKNILLFLISLIFFIISSITEISLWNKEISKEVYLNHPHYFVQRSSFLNPFFLETNVFTNYPYFYMIDLDYGRRDIKKLHKMYFDIWSDNHVLGSIYAALRTGLSLDKLKSFNFVTGNIDFTNNQPFAAIYDFKKPTFYFSTPLLTGKILYNLYPSNLRYIDTLDKELKASYYTNNVRLYMILINYLLWSIFIFIIGYRFGIIYSIVSSIAIFTFPGSSLMMMSFYKGVIMLYLFPLYILSSYKLLYSNKLYKKILFYMILLLLMFIQWNLNHWISMIFQLPIIMFSLALSHFTHDYNEYNKDYFSIIINHIKKYTLQYMFILLYSLVLAYFVLDINKKIALKLQPNKVYSIDYAINVRPKIEGKISLIFIDMKKGYLDKESFVYSKERRIKHNIVSLKKYINYPIIYPTWRLEQYLPNSINSIIYKLFKMPYLTSFQLLIIALILNIFIFIKYKNYRNNIFIAGLFIIGIGIWMLIYFNFDSRVSSHYHLYPHLIMIVISLSIVIYNTFLLKLISKINFNKNLHLK